MDPVVIKEYRRLLREGFRYAGEIDEPTIFLDTVRENYRMCGARDNYMYLYISICRDQISDIKYLCTCVPAVNVAAEILCSLALGRPLAEVEQLTDDSFCKALGEESEELREKARGLLELLNTGLARYRAEVAGRESIPGDSPLAGATR
jgi:NifU-like protein involved in Fe-S cluster formation